MQFNPHDSGNVKRFYPITLLGIAALLLTAVACSTKKNTAGTRRWHAFTARYNTYFNGKTSFDEQLEAMQNSYHENYTERILMYPVSALPKDKQAPGGPFDRAILKGNKAIKQHSIRKKPQRKAGRADDARWRALINREEYNPFLKHCWMLVADGQFYNGDFLQAAATYSYIARHYATEPEVATAAQIGRARCYAEMGWLYETESALERIEKNGFPAANRRAYDRVYADYLVKSNRTEQAIPALRKVIDTERNRLQRTRFRYLLGQLLAETGRNDEAYREFGRVASASPPYELEFAARIRQAEVLPPSRWQQVLTMLRRMSKSDKNKNYLDQVFMAIGDVYMSRRDTTRAVEAYEQGVEKSTQNGLDLAICQIKLGDIYFTQKDYVKAQPCFSGALSAMPREYHDYERVARLSAVLDELVVHVESVHLQDSLQELARMPEAERLALIDKRIEEVKAEEKRLAEASDKERYLAEQQGRGNAFANQRPGMPATPQMPMIGGSGSTFYFYNEQTVAQGKTQFQNRWGKRVNQDDWRRRDKAMPLTTPDDGTLAADSMRFDDDGNPIIAAGDSAASALPDSLASDPRSREYYLQQIPFSAEDVEASNVIIADGLYNMGMIYKDKLENMPLSVETFEELERRFPENKYRMDYYFQSYLMGLRYKDKPLETRSRDRLVKAFPGSDYATAVADPNYEYHIRMMDRVQDSIYEQAYNRYLTGDTSFVRRSFRDFSRTYPLATLMPKFMFIEALTYVQAGDAASFKSALQKLVEKFPTADVTELANEMLKGVLRGRALVQGSLTGMKWDLRFGSNEFGEITAVDSARAFVDEPASPHRMVLLYPAGAVDRNALLYAVAAYNFAHFEVKSFDLTTESAGSFGMLIVSGFSDLAQVLDYYGMIYAPDGYARTVDRAVSFFPISDANYETLMHGKSPSEYMAFFAKVYGRQAPQLVARWRAQVEADEREAARADKAVEQAADEVKERVQDTDEPVFDEPSMDEPSTDEPEPEAVAPPESSSVTVQPDTPEEVASADTTSVEQQPTASVKKKKEKKVKEKKSKAEKEREKAEKAEKKKQEKAAKAAKAEKKKKEKTSSTSVRHRRNKKSDPAASTPVDTTTSTELSTPTDTTALTEPAIPADTSAMSDLTPADTVVMPEVDPDTVLVKPKEITLEYLQKRREVEERKSRMAQEEKAQTQAERRQEAAEQRKQLLKEREAQRKQKEKEARERMKQREKERKAREKANKQRLKEKEAARRAAQREKEAARREKAKSK